VLVGAYVLHMWVGIRRDGLGRVDAARSFWDGVKKRWDWAVAAVIALAPVAWSAVLDIIVITANLLATVFPKVAGVDLSALMLTDAHKTLIQLSALALPPLRDAIEKMRGKG
jgi:hypothetical protein